MLLTMALDQLARRVDADAALHRDRLNEWGQMLQDGIEKMRDCGAQQHAALNAKIDHVSERVDEHAERFQELAIVAAEKRGARKLVSDVFGTAKSVADSTGLLHVAAGAGIALVMPALWNLFVGSSHGEPPRPEPLGPMQIERAQAVTVELAEPPEGLRGFTAD
ncbi:MAG: hypothetical protein NW206_20060 [Hyphomonadaceae bacterium]|nr:hypothetical protein [Hyphomonadaceae bacterium]